MGVEAVEVIPCTCDIACMQRQHIWTEIICINLQLIMQQSQLISICNLIHHFISCIAPLSHNQQLYTKNDILRSPMMSAELLSKRALDTSNFHLQLPWTYDRVPLKKKLFNPYQVRIKLEFQQIYSVRYGHGAQRATRKVVDLGHLNLLSSKISLPLSFKHFPLKML